MKKRLSLILAALLSVSLLAGCGAGTSTTAASGTGSAGTSATTEVAGTTDCPTEGTRTFAKTRFVIDVGLAAGTFHRYIYKPYQEGKFAKGADGRTLAITKAVATAALDAKLLSNARENVKADPTLCKALSAPLDKAAQALNDLKGKVLSGDLTSLASVEAIIASVLGTSRSNGLTITETTDESLAQ